MNKNLRLSLAVGLAATLVACGRQVTFASKGRGGATNHAAKSADGVDAAPGATAGGGPASGDAASGGTDGGGASGGNSDTTDAVDKASGSGDAVKDSADSISAADAAKKMAAADDQLSQSEAAKKVNATALKAACDNPDAVKRIDQEIFFPKPTATCPWGVDGNLPFDVRHQLIFTARREQNAALTLPPHAVVCGLEFDFPEAPMRYDDEILLTYDGVVLMASQDLSDPGELKTDAAGLLHWDWLNVLNHHYDIRKRPPYFVEKDCGAACELPPTETTGKVRLEVLPPTIQKITVDVAQSGVVGSPNFSFITMGDNDFDVDCLHNDFRFSVHAQYVLTSALPSP